MRLMWLLLAMTLVTGDLACQAGRPAAGRSTVTKAPVLKGLGTWYGKSFHGKRTASGERFDMHRLTAAHKRLPFGTLVEVTNLRNRRTVVVRITDRGPFGKGRIIDLSRAAAKQLGMLVSGVVPVKVTVKKWGQNCRTFHGRKTCRPSGRVAPRSAAKRPRPSAKRPRARAGHARKRMP